MLKKVFLPLVVLCALFVVQPSSALMIVGTMSEAIDEPASADLGEVDTLSMTAAGEIVKYTDDSCVYEGDVAIACPAECNDSKGNFVTGCRRLDDGTYYLPTSVQISAAVLPADSEIISSTNEAVTTEPAVVAGPNDCNGMLDCIEAAVDPELWPVLLSVSALILAILLITVINTISRRKARKDAKDA